MAQHVTVLLVDDLDGGEATETVTFALDGTAYEIDLSEPNAAKLRGGILPYAEHARRAGSRASSNGGPKRRSKANRVRAADIRAWGRQQGYTISDLGRIPPAVVAEYDKAHS